MARIYKFRWFFYIVIFFLFFRATLPFAGLKIINYMLEHKMENYTGKISNFDLALIAGEYKMGDLKIVKKTTPSSPVLDVMSVYINLRWTDLFSGNLRGDLALIAPHFYLTDEKEKDQKEPITKEDKKAGVSMIINRLDIQEGTFHFTNLDVKKINEITIDRINGFIKNIKTDDLKERSQLQFRGRFQNHAPLLIGGEMSLETPWRGNIEFKLENFNIPSINDTLRAYIPIDITRGIMSVYGEIKTNEEEQIGYMKIIIKDPKVIASKQEFIGPKHFLVEIFGGFFNWVLKNDNTNKIAVEIPIETEEGEWTYDTPEAFWSIVENKFNQITPEIEGRY